MLFNSYLFIFIFLPIMLLVYNLTCSKGYYRLSISWLIIGSLFFYGWWNPVYLSLIITSIIVNFFTSLYLNKYKKKIVLIIGIILNLGLIGYFKYFYFFLENLTFLTEYSYKFENVILPLAISFFTFQQIAYLVDTYREKVKEYDFLNYCLFVTFFPQLIAGPIVQYKEIVPQFTKSLLKKLNSENLAIGFTIFTIGLFKKVVIADGISVFSTPVFNSAEKEMVLTVLEAWVGAFAYTFQLYFDFSGYSDMALGLARMFGIMLPLNFHSPFKAVNIIDFWRRWHITLSRFLRNYLYIPLGGNRHGTTKRYANLLLTMLLGGLWHGAGWTFIFWGMLHGFFLIINNGWHSIKKQLNLKGNFDSNIFVITISKLFTFVVVVVAFVLFRAETIDGAMNIYTSMSGFKGSFFYTINEQPVLQNIFRSIFLILILTIFVMVFPNTQQIMINYLKYNSLIYKSIEIWWNGFGVWQPSIKYALLTVFALLFCLSLLQGNSEFLYFRF